MARAPAPPDRSQRTATIVLAILLGVFGLWISATFIPSLLWAAIIAIAIDPLYQRCENRWPRHRTIALPAIATLLIALLILGPLTLGVIEAAREARGLMDWLGNVRENGMPEPVWVQQLPFAGELSTWWQANLATPEGTANQLHRFNREMLISQSQLLGKGLIHRSIIFAFTLIALFFVLRDRDALVEQLKRAGTRLLGPAGGRIGTQLVKSVRGTIDGLVLVGIGEGVVMALVYVVAGVPHPLLLGFMTAIAAMIPFGAAVLFAVASALLVGEGQVGWAVAVFAIGMGVVFVADHFIRPVLIGGSTRLPFLWVLIGILGGVETMGLIGLFVGPAAMATLIMLWRDYQHDGAIDGSEPPASPAAPPPRSRG